MSMEAEVMRSRCVALVGSAIEAADALNKRTITLDEARSLMMALMRLPLPDSQPRVPLRNVGSAVVDEDIFGKEGIGTDGTR